MSIKHYLDSLKQPRHHGNFGVPTPEEARQLARARKRREDNSRLRALKDLCPPSSGDSEDPGRNMLASLGVPCEELYPYLFKKRK